MTHLTSGLADRPDWASRPAGRWRRAWRALAHRETTKEPLGLPLQRRGSVDDEHRRTPADVHDEVIQDLAGLRYAVTSAASHLPPDTSPDVASVLSAADGILYRTVLRLRGLLHDDDPDRVP